MFLKSRSVENRFCVVNWKCCHVFFVILCIFPKIKVDQDSVNLVGDKIRFLFSFFFQEGVDSLENEFD